MKTLSHRSVFFLLFLLTASFLLAALPSRSLAQGKKIYVSGTNGYLEYPDAQATLNLHDDDTVMIIGGKYKYMNFKNITASPGHKIYIINDGLVEFEDPSPSTFSNLTNVEIKGNGTPGIDFGFYMHDLIRGIYIDGHMSGVYFSYIKMVNIADYAIFLYNPSLVYNGTNNSLFYDLKFLHFSVYNIMTSWLQVGVYTRIVDDGMINMVRKLEVAYCTVDYTDQEDVLHLNKVVNANIHHNRFSHLGKNDFRHTGIVYLYGSGDVHHNYINDYWGSGLRAHAFNLDTIGAINVYNNIMLDSRKYSGVEAQCTIEDLAYSPYMHYCNFKIYNNTFGKLHALDWQASMVDTYDAVGGTIEIKNNLGFNIERGVTNDPSNYAYTRLNVTMPDTAGNRYYQTYTAAGLIDDSTCLLNYNSPVIDKGITIPMVTDDIDGVARPQSAAYDIGAREYASGIIHPVSNAGKDTSTVLPKDSVSLDGSASYNPGGGAVTYKWTQVAGPSAAVFVNDTDVKPVLKALVAGTYQIKLTVSNAQGNTGEDIVVVVVSSVPVFPPVANAGGTVTISLPVNSTELNGTGSSNSAGGALKYAWIKISGPSYFTISGDTTATPFISSLTSGTYQLRLTVTNINGLSSTDIATVVVKPVPVPVANAGNDINLVLPANSTTLDGRASTTPDGGALSYVWTAVAGPDDFTISGENTAVASLSNLVEGVYQFELTVTNSAGITNTDFVNITVAAAPVAMADAGADINIVLPTSSVTLDGTASNSTGGGTLTYLWSLVSGPSSFTISGATTPTPVISNLVQGTYQLKLKVTNAEGSSAEDIVAVTVSAIPVYPPVSNAGPDVAITLPASTVALNGEQSYNPGGGALTYAWSLLSGPSSFTITGAATATPTISNLMQGAYHLQLKVTNTHGLSAEDEIVVTVSPAPPPPPVANAGPDASITLPANSITLNGNASTTNDPMVVLTYLWSKVSGPASFTITGAATATPALSNLTQGVYQIKLIVTNAQGLSAEDVVAITVNAAVPPVAVASSGGAINLTLPANSVTLNGATSYNAAGGSLSYNWSKVSGPADFAIAGSTTATPLVSNLSQGVYQVRLTVTNISGASASDIVTINVNLALLSVANAGHDTTINFPNGYAILNGNGSYGTGGAVIATYHWQQLSGPTAAVFSNSEAHQTLATNLEPGNYIFQLTVVDNYGQVARTTVKVAVVNTVRNAKRILVYPNPCSDVVHIRMLTDSMGTGIIRITNLSGIVMLRQSFQKNQLALDQSIPVSSLPAGMYIAEVIIGNDVQLLAKFVKR